MCNNFSGRVFEVPSFAKEIAATTESDFDKRANRPFLIRYFEGYDWPDGRETSEHSTSELLLEYESLNF